MSQENPEKKFEKYREALRRDCQRALASWQIYKQIMNYIATENTAINISPGFFANCRAAFLDQTVLLLVKILDKRNKNTLSLYSFLAFIQRHMATINKTGYININKMIFDDLTRLETKNATISNLRKRRNYTVAHTDQTHVLRAIKVHKTNPVTVGEVDNIFKLIEEIFNKYSSCFDNVHYIFSVFGNEDLSRTIELIKIWRSAELAKLTK